MTPTRRLLLLAALFCAIDAVAQPLINLQTRRHELGSILWKHPAKVIFEIGNRGTSPLLITDVHPDCGCTVAEWTTDSIHPGQVGKIAVTYDAEMLGSFEKQIAVNTNAEREPFYLTLSGDVVREKTDYSYQFPYHIGDIYYNRNEIVFDDVYSGDLPQDTILLLNGSGKTYEPALMHLPPYLTMEAVPDRISSGKTGKIILTLDSRKLHDIGLTRTSVYLSRYPGDRVSDENEIPVSALLLPPVVNLTPQQAGMSPVCTLDRTFIDLGSFDGKKWKKCEFTLTNTGRSTLSVQALQVYHPCLSVALGEKELAPGQRTYIRVTATAEHLNWSKSRPRILLITNDPASPKKILEVKISR